MEKDDFGRLCKKHRINKDLSVNKLSRLIGYSPQHIRLIEKGKSGPGLDILVKLVRVLEISPGNIFSDENGGPEEGNDEHL